MTLKVGDVLYYVVEVDMPDDHGIHTWKVESERVKQVRRDGSFKLDRAFYFQRIYKAHNIDTRFHRTPEAAVEAFIEAQNQNIHSANRAINEAKRAIRWAASTTAPAASKRMHVRCAREAEYPSSYVFELETKRDGKRRVHPPGIGKHDEAAATNSEVLRAWFKRLGITHVVSVFGEKKTERECIADGTYTVTQYIRWWKRAES